MKSRGDWNHLLTWCSLRQPSEYSVWSVERKRQIHYSRIVSEEVLAAEVIARVLGEAAEGLQTHRRHDILSSAHTE